VKIEAASAEEHAFAATVNREMKEAATVSPFTQVDEATDTRTYCLVFSCGSKRHTITSDAPFHYDSPDEVVKRVQAWVANRGGQQLYSPDMKYAE
jgi:hypothetical protein